MMQRVRKAHLHTGKSLSFKTFSDKFPLSIKTPQLKDRRFERIRLANGLEAFVISDKNSTSVSAALSCEVGSWHDGQFAGTAHFLEHMLFLGTKKYSSSNDYEKFIYDNGGSLNGYTANDHSLYYFNHLNPSAFAGGLDRFSRFFYEPLFDESCVDRERNAVHEEYKKNIESDGWRILHVKKELADPSHPISQFNTGNLETMTFSRQYLIDWYEKTYSAEKMNLVVLGKEPLDELTEMTADAFSPIPSKPSPLLKPSSVPSTIWSSLKGQVVWIDTIKDIRELSLSWEIPFSFIDKKTKTASLLSGIIGHEGPQSILHLLKARGWAEGLSAGPEHHGLENVSFTITVSLTKEGIRNWRHVIDIIDRSLQKLASLQAADLRYLFNESNKMSKIAYEFQQRNADIAITYCEALRLEPIESFPLHSLLISQFDQDALSSLLKRLVLNECHTTIATKETAPVHLDKKEKWMFARYTVFPLTQMDCGTSDANSSSITDSIHGVESIHVPEENVFIPNQLDLNKRASSSVPLSIQVGQGNEVSVFYYPDDEFQVPEASFSFVLKSAKIRPDDPVSMVLANLYLRFVFEQLNPVAYDSTSAGLHYNLAVSKNNGISLSVNGYSEKCLLLLEKVLLAMKTVRFDQEGKFEIFQNSLLRKFENAAKNSPVQQSFEALYHRIMDHHTLNETLARAVSTVTPAQLQEFKDSWFRERVIEGFVGGNVEENQAVQALNLVQTTFPGCEPSSKEAILEAKYSSSALSVPQILSKTFQVSGNALVHTIDVGKRTDLLRCHWGILSTLLQEPFYTELRTNQQTGYIVNCSGSQIKKQLFINAVIQSNKYDPRDLLSRVELFYEQFLRQMDSPETLDRFEKIKESSIQKLEMPFDRLTSKMDFYRTLTFEEDGDYQLLQRRLDLMRAVQLEDVKKTAFQILSLDRNQKRLAILATGTDAENRANSYRPISE